MHNLMIYSLVRENPFNLGVLGYGFLGQKMGGKNSVCDMGKKKYSESTWCLKKHPPTSI